MSKPFDNREEVHYFLSKKNIQQTMENKQFVQLLVGKNIVYCSIACHKKLLQILLASEYIYDPHLVQKNIPSKL